MHEAFGLTSTVWARRRQTRRWIRGSRRWCSSWPSSVEEPRTWRRPRSTRQRRAASRHLRRRCLTRGGGQAAAACDAMGASAFATGNHVAFAQSPDLHTAAHEAAHVVQQARGVNLYGGVGAAGDAYERHADAVADRVVAGHSAADLLTAGPPGSGTSTAVQRDDKPTGATDTKTPDPTAPSAPAAPAADMVTTTWYVNYNVPGGKTRSLPERKGDDQMIVDQLKVDSNNRGPKAKPVP